MEYIVRKYKPEDRERVREICHLTATAPNYVADKNLVASLYAEYYTDYEPENIFIVARAESDLAVGYILCAENYKTYIKTFKSKQSKVVARYSRKEAIMHRLSFVLERIDGKKYPAHLHIDILPEAQRKGFGTQLVDTLVKHLKNKGVKGVKLGVGGDNEKGISFYKKYGFSLIHDFGNAGKVFGLDLTK